MPLAFLAVSLLLSACTNAGQIADVAGTNLTMTREMVIPSRIPQATTAPSATYILAPTDTIVPTKTSTVTPTSTSTLTPTPTPQLFKLQLTAFWDYDGDGEIDVEEPILEGIVIKIQDVQCSTDDGGICVFTALPEGSYELEIAAPANFRYLTPDVVTDISLSDGYDVVLESDKEILLPITEGPYRNPFHGLSSIEVGNWKDLGTDSCGGSFPDFLCETNLDWLGGRNTYDGHSGTDFENGWNSSLDVYGMRTGTVYDLRHLGDTDGWELLVKDDQPYSGKNSFQHYVHLNELDPSIKIGAAIDPTTFIGTRTEKGAVHIGFWINVPDNVHPLDGPEALPPRSTRATCPFDAHLWVSRFVFPELIDLDDNEKTIIQPPFYTNEG